MGHNVFVSYKFSDAVDTRDEIRRKLGNEGHYYNGERGYTPLYLATDSIKRYLKDMIFGTSVTVAVISPQVKESDWVDWEIRYSLRQETRSGRTSNRNGIVCVIQTVKDWYGNENCNWAKDYNGKYRREIFPQAIIDNLQQSYHSGWSSAYGYSLLNKDYCVVVSETEFKRDPGKYIDEAFRRAYDGSYEIVVNKQAY